LGNKVPWGAVKIQRKKKTKNRIKGKPMRGRGVKIYNQNSMKSKAKRGRSTQVSRQQSRGGPSALSKREEPKS